MHIRRLYRTLRRPAVIAVGFRCLGIVQVLAIAFALSRWGGTAAVGVFSEAQAYALVLSAPLSLGFQGIIHRYAAEYEHRAQPGGAAVLSRAVSLTSLGLIIVSAICGALAFAAPAQMLPLVTIAIAGAMAATANISRYLQFFGQQISASILTGVAVPTAALIVLAVWIFASAGVDGATFVKIYALASAVVALVGLVMLGDRKAQGATLTRSDWRHSMRSWLDVGAANVVSVFLFYLSSRSDIIVASLFFNDATLGKYAIVRRLADLVLLPVSAMLPVFTPNIARLAVGQTGEGLARALARYMILFTGAGSGVAILVLAGAPLFLIVSQVTPVAAYVGITMIASLSQSVLVIVAPFGPLLSASGRHVRYTVCLAIGAVTKTASVALGAWLAGLPGAAAGLVVGSVVYAGLMFGSARTIVRIDQGDFRGAARALRDG